MSRLPTHVEMILEHVRVTPTGTLSLSMGVVNTSIGGVNIESGISLFSAVPPDCSLLVVQVASEVVAVNCP